MERLRGQIEATADATLRDLLDELSEYPAPVEEDSRHQDGEKPQDEQQRWTAKRRVALVVGILKGEILEEASGWPAEAQHDLKRALAIRRATSAIFTPTRSSSSNDCRGQRARAADGKLRRPQVSTA